jgi:hypothetical protein
VTRRCSHAVVVTLCLAAAVSVAASPQTKRPPAPRSTAAATAKPAWTRAAMRDFLLTAKVIRSSGSDKGVTKPQRLTLSDGKRTHDASFQSVDERRPSTLSERTGLNVMEMNFVDSYHYNLAAYALAEALGIGAMMPVHVEREWDGRTGSLSWWEDVQMDEEDRRKKNVQPSNAIDWNHQMYRMRVFAALIRDTDRNLGNILYGPDWRVIMIDFTRAFRSSSELVNEKDLTIVDRNLLKNITALTRDRVKAVVGEHLTDGEIAAVMLRRDKLVAHYQQVIAERGERRVLY